MATDNSERNYVSLDPRLRINEEYGRISRRGSVSKLDARFDVYNKARVKADNILGQLYKGLAVKPTDTVVDVGCSKGGSLDLIFTQFLGHQGLLVGVDVNYKVLERGSQDFPTIKFVDSNAMNLCLRNNSVDIVMSLFTLYHIPEPETALGEMSRVLRADGRAVVTTSGVNNKTRHREYERRVADYLDVSHPLVYSEPFNANNAERMISDRFLIEYHGHQDDEMVFDRSNINIYLGSLATMYTTCQPRVTQREWVRAINRVVAPEIRQELAEKGEFVDTIDRHFYLGTPLE